MLIGSYFKNLNLKYKKHFFSGLSFNSKKVKKNNIFFAIKGTKINGNKFIKEAVKKGATTIVSNLDFEGVKNGILYIKSNNSRKLLSEVASKVYRHKPKNLIAVTGTNGKSSIADFYFQILNLNNKKVASIGTLGINTFVAIFPTSKPKYVLVVLLDEPKPNKEYIYHYRDGRPSYKGNWRNTAGWTSVEIAGKIIEKIGPILATKYKQAN